MKRSIRGLLYLAAVLSMIQLGYTLAHAEEQEEVIQAAEETMALEGTVVGLDQETATIAIEQVTDAEANVTSITQLEVSEEAVIIIDEEPATLADINIDDTVELTYLVDAEGKKIVSTLEVRN